VDRFFSFNFTGSLLAVYGVLFGVLSKLFGFHQAVPVRGRPPGTFFLTPTQTHHPILIL
jgi:hypothetical protein